MVNIRFEYGLLYGPLQAMYGLCTAGHGQFMVDMELTNNNFTLLVIRSAFALYSPNDPALSADQTGTDPGRRVGGPGYPREGRRRAGDAEPLRPIRLVHVRPTARVADGRAGRRRIGKRGSRTDRWASKGARRSRPRRPGNGRGSGPAGRQMDGLGNSLEGLLVLLRDERYGAQRRKTTPSPSHGAGPQMDGLGNSLEGLLVLCATNLPWSIDSAVTPPPSPHTHKSIQVTVWMML